MSTTTGDNNLQPKHSLATQLSVVLLVAGLLLLIPLVAMQYSDEMNWDIADFVAAGVLIVGTGTAYVFLTIKRESRRARLLIGAVLGLAFLLTWAELAVGLFD